MKAKLLILMLFLVLCNQSFPFRWEMGLVVVGENWQPIEKHVVLYKDYGFYIEYYDDGYTTSEFIEEVNGACDVLYCDQTNIDTNNPIFEPPLSAGTYILKIDNIYCRFTFNDYDCVPQPGAPDFKIQYRLGVFELVLSSWAVRDIDIIIWDKILGTFKQIKADGATSTGTVAIGQSPFFSERYSPPFNFFVNPNENYLFHSDTLIQSDQKYYKWQDITDVKNFRVKNSGTTNFEIRANFNWTFEGITIQNYFLECPLLNPDNDIIQFKDPWLIDYKDAAFGNHRRNRGMDDAIYWNRPSPFYPDYYNLFGGNSHKGIFLNQPYTGSNPVYYSVKSNTQNIILFNTGNPTGRNHQFYFRNWFYDPDKISLQTPGSNETAVVFKTSDAELSAKLKGTNLTDNTDAYNSTSQRKFLKTPDGLLHSVYSSLNRVWYEQSTDNGVSWIIANQNKPLDIIEGKLPSIDYGYYDDPEGSNDIYWTVIVFQEKYGSGFKIRAKSFQKTVVDEFYVRKDSTDIATYSSESYSNNANPVLAVDVVGYCTFIWEQKSGTAGLYRRNGQVSTNGLSLSGSNTQLTGTNVYSTNPSITVTKLWFSGSTRHIVWQAPGLVNSTDIIYTTYEYQGSQSGTTNISNGNGYPINYSPSVSMTVDKVIVSWTGFFDGNMNKILGEDDVLLLKKVFVKVKSGTGWGTFTVLGDNVNFVNNNSVSSSEKTVFVWSQGTTPQSKWVKRTGPSGQYNTIETLSHSGIQNQVSTGSDYNNMYAMVFNNQSVPYYFIKTTTDFSVVSGGGEINKLTSAEQISYGRSGVVNKNGVEFVFNTGDIFVADSSVQFVFIPDTIQFNSPEEINTVARTEDFHLSEGVDFFFSNLYYVIRQELADSVLTEQDQVNFKVELVKAQNNEVIGSFDDVTYNKYNLEKYANINYQVNCSGIQQGDYYLRLVTAVEGQANYNVSNIQRDGVDLNKMNQVMVSFTGENMPVTYELSQNFPNPFNPATKIRYQLPESGNVTLKVYDILGAKVATLVDAFQNEGRYEVNFDAKSLASGVYIYRLKINEFANVKKMLLVK